MPCCCTRYEVARNCAEPLSSLVDYSTRLLTLSPRDLAASRCHSRPRMVARPRSGLFMTTRVLVSEWPCTTLTRYICENGCYEPDLVPPAVSIKLYVLIIVLTNRCCKLVRHWVRSQLLQDGYLKEHASVPQHQEHHFEEVRRALQGYL